jgi:DNA-binding response OmpR family regulator
MKTILIIEDEFEIRDTLKEFLELEGYEVLAAENGLVALELLGHSEPNLILLDMMMPVMNGWEFAAAYYAKFSTPSPIIVLTAAANAEQRARDVKAISWTEKPFNFYELLEKIKAHIR